LKPTQESSMNKCEEMECLAISIYKNHSKAFHYSVWYGNNFLGEIVEDEILILLGNEVKKFYSDKQVNFLVPKKLIKNIVKKPKYY